MSRKFKLPKDYLGDGVELWKKRTIVINPGVTVLVGCNGIGKTSLLHCIKNQLKKENVPCISFDNLHDGGSNARSEAAFHENYGLVASLMCSSEGESIVINMGMLASKLRHFVEKGDDGDRINKLAMAFAKINGEKMEEQEESNERWILLDAIDSGLSIDNIVDVKEYLFKTILENNFGKEIYILVVANEYEMAHGEDCFDVHNGKYVKFTDYEDYRNFVLKSKEWKDKRDEVLSDAESEE